ncbi:hypothetical protein ACFL6G_08615 [candidate division KSB1 bacterium]
MRLEKIRNNFFIRFLVLSAVFLLIWKPISFVYMHIIAFFSNILTGLIHPYLDISVIDGILKFRYNNISAQILQFSVNEVEQVFLNLIVFLCLMISSYRVDLKPRLKYLTAGLLILILIHVFVINMYAYTTIWDYVLNLPDEIKAGLIPRIEMYFSGGITNIYRKLLFNWNSWGWDVIPLLLWLPAGLLQFQPVIRKITEK